MLKQDYLMGIDVGTQGTKIIVMDTSGIVIAKGHHSYDFQVKHPGWAEQDPLLWWDAVCRVLEQIWSQDVNPEQIKGIGVSGQMHSLVLLNKEEKELGNAILWNDVRTEGTCKEIEKIVGKKKSFSITRNAILPGFTAPKLLWIKQNEPDRYAQIRHIMLPKDYIVYKLSGVFSCDVSDASGTSLFNVEERSWSMAMLDALDIPHEWVPAVHESQTVVGSVSRDATAATGLKKGIKIVAGAGDNAASALGNGIYEEGTGVVSVGTSGTVFAPLKELPPIMDGEQLETLHLFCHCLPDTWHAMGVTLSAGMSLNWFKETFSKGTYDELLAGLENIPAGSEGLLYLPYLNGERTPHNDPDARGVFFGMAYHHSRHHFTRSVLEGVSYSLKDCYELIKKCNIEVKDLYVTGGASKSPVWRQILSDILAQHLTVFEEREGPAYGASLLAGLGVGIWNSPADFPSFFEEEDITTVNHLDAELYKKNHTIYKALYKHLKPLFKHDKEIGF